MPSAFMAQQRKGIRRGKRPSRAVQVHPSPPKYASESESDTPSQSASEEIELDSEAALDSEEDVYVSDDERQEAQAMGAALDVDDAIRAYQQALDAKGRGLAGTAGSGSEASDDASASDGDSDAGSDVSEAASDSSEEERPQRNTVGDVPLSWYDDEQHIGYDQAGQRIEKSKRKDKLDTLIERNDDPDAWRKVYDQYNDEEIVLSKEEMRMIQNIRAGRFAHADTMELYPEENDWFSRHQEVMPLSAAPEPKSRFTPSKWEEKKVVKLVRAIRKGWLNTQAQPKAPTVYELWADEGGESQRTMAGLSYLAAPKMKLPGHEESYNPPREYLLTKEEENAAALEAEENDEPEPFIPKAFESLRKVPAYDRFIKERFERCLDLYLCPRARVNRMDVSDPASLIPKLPKPKDLQPFPAILSVRYVGHASKVTSLSVHPSGQWLATGSKDGTVKVWEIKTGRCIETFDFASAEAQKDHAGRTSGKLAVHTVAWCPKRDLGLVAVAIGKRVLLVPVKLNDAVYQETIAVVHSCCGDAPAGEDAGEGADEDAKDSSTVAKWSLDPSTVTSTKSGTTRTVSVAHNFEVRDVTWHAAGDYFSSVCPRGNTKAVLVHQLSKGHSQNPFRKNKGIVARTLFHPTKPFFFVATQQAVRIYNLAKQSLAKKLVSGSGVITSMSIHPSGDHVILGGEDRRVCWFDLDLSTKPYRALRYHDAAIRGVAFHPTYPLFASASDDGTTHVFHGKVFSDLMTNPMIVPVKILKGHAKTKSGEGATSVVFHPNQPWVFTGGADGNAFLYCNP